VDVACSVKRPNDLRHAGTKASESNQDAQPALPAAACSASPYPGTQPQLASTDLATLAICQPLIQDDHSSLRSSIQLVASVRRGQ